MLPLFQRDPTCCIDLTIVALCILGLHESDIAKAPLFVAFSTVVSVQKWQQDIKEALNFSPHLATNRLAHTPHSSQSKKGLVRLLPGSFGLVSPAMLPVRYCRTELPGEWWPGHLDSIFEGKISAKSGGNITQTEAYRIL
jgi:hypothetical protein